MTPEARQWLVRELMRRRPELPLPKSELILTIQEREAMLIRLLPSKGKKCASGLMSKIGCRQLG